MKVPLLDLGNVVVKVETNPFFDWLSARSQENANVRGLWSSSLFYDFEFGNISREEFADRVRKLYGADFTQPELEAAFCGIFPGMVDGMESLLSEFSETGPIYCLSNTNEIHLNFCREQFPVLNKFTKIFASHEIRRRKPYPGIYRDVINELGIPASSMVFFDDVQGNVDGARRAGLEAHLFESSAQIKDLLKKTVQMDDKGNEGDSYEGNQ